MVQVGLIRSSKRTSVSRPIPFEGGRHLAQTTRCVLCQRYIARIEQRSRSGAAQSLSSLTRSNQKVDEPSELLNRGSSGAKRSPEHGNFSIIGWGRISYRMSLRHAAQVKLRVGGRPVACPVVRQATDNAQSSKATRRHGKPCHIQRGA